MALVRRSQQNGATSPADCHETANIHVSGGTLRYTCMSWRQQQTARIPLPAGERSLLRALATVRNERADEIGPNPGQSSKAYPAHPAFEKVRPLHSAARGALRPHAQRFPHLHGVPAQAGVPAGRVDEKRTIGGYSFSLWAGPKDWQTACHNPSVIVAIRRDTAGRALRRLRQSPFITVGQVLHAPSNVGDRLGPSLHRQRPRRTPIALAQLSRM